MRMTGFIIKLLAAFCTVAFLCGPVLAEEGEEKSTEVAAEIDKEGAAGTPPVEAAPGEATEEQEEVAEEEAAD